MRPARRLVLLSLLAALASAGCSLMLYPFALAFGGRKESELATSRIAFVEMKKTIATGPVVVFPVRVFRNWQPAFEPEPARTLVDLLASEMNPNAELSPVTPTAPDTPHGGNQLRYLNLRGDAYAAWVRATKPASTGHLVFVEVLADAEGREIYGGYVWILDPAGRIAWERLYNSHHFDPREMAGVTSFFHFVLRSFRQALDEGAEHSFPRYGVG